jgi:hypothetical protein
MFIYSGQILYWYRYVLRSSVTKHFEHRFLPSMVKDIHISSVAEPEPDPEPEPQGAASFGRSRSRNAMRLRLRLRQWYLSWLGI